MNREGSRIKLEIRQDHGGFVKDPGRKEYAIYIQNVIRKTIQIQKRIYIYFRENVKAIMYDIKLEQLAKENITIIQNLYWVHIDRKII